MSRNEVIITIEPPYTLNRRWDNADPQRPTGFFWDLQNYVPKWGILVTRDGTTALTYTAQTT